MKVSLVAAFSLLLSQSSAFHVAPARQCSWTQIGMFSGAGEGKPTQDNPEEQAQIEAAAKAMGMNADEYMIAMNARKKLQENLDAGMVSSGNADTVLVDRDLNNPPKTLEIKITAAGKELGQDAISKELVSNLKKASDEARKGRADAQKTMMEFISQQLK